MVTETTSFKVSTALKSLIGKELITNDYVAVFELVKNSFDANAKNICVYFDLFEGSITIEDDGCGMSLEDIKNKWFFIGYSEKKNDKSASYSGNKGIGRFACDRLGHVLEVSTTKDGVNSRFTVDWDQFDNGQDYEIQSYSIIISTTTNNNPSGTVLKISGLRKEWNEKDVEKTKNQLQKLLSPISFDLTRNLSISLVDKNGVSFEDKQLRNDVFDYMRDRVVLVSSVFTNDSIVTTLLDHGKTIVQNISKNNTLIKSASMYLYFADRNAKTIFKKKTGYDLIDYGNLFVYKNGFRIYPFGERGYDVFGLSQRKSQGFYRFLGPREIIGWISIVDGENNFIEATSRDRGFLENEYSRSLEESYMEYVHIPLEKYVELLKYGNISLGEYLSLESAPVVIDRIANTFTLKNSISVTVDNNIIESKLSDEAILKLRDETLSKKEKDEIIKNTIKQINLQRQEHSKNIVTIGKYEKENKALKKEIDAKNLFIDNANPSRQGVLEHDLGLVVRRLKATISGLINLNNSLKSNELDCYIQSIAKNVYRINSIRNFILKTKLNTKTKTEIKVGAFLSEYSKTTEFEHIKIETFIENEFILKANVFDVVTIFDNFLSNIDNLHGTKLDVYVKSNSISFVSDTYSDETDVDFNRVFDYGYTTTEGGTGIGMFIVKQICDEYKMDICMSRIDNTDMVKMEIKKNA